MAIRPPTWLGRFRRHKVSEQHQTTSEMRAVLTSPTYERHIGVIDLEEAAKRSTKASGPQSLSMAWDDSFSGVRGLYYRDGLMSERDRKDTYYKAYLGNPWVRACVDSIAKRFTSGGWEIEETEQGKGIEANRDTLKELFLFVNDDEDFKQHLRSIAVDLGIYGEAFDEIVYQNGGPVALHKIDCATMTTIFDKRGNVEKYIQNLEKSSDSVVFEPEQVIRWWLPDPRAGKKALSPIEGIKDAVYLYQAMTTWAEKFFKQGAKPSFTVKMGEDSSIDDANRYIKFFKENYTGITNAHVPPVLYGGSELVEFGKGSIEMDFIVGRDKCRDEILAGYNVPLSVIGIQESAHLGGGTGDAANKFFLYNAVKPIEELILEKLNYRLIQNAFGILDWVVTVRHADFRDDEAIARLGDIQLRNGSLTINEARLERGRGPIPGGDTAIFVASRDIMPVEVLADMAEEHRQQVALSQAGAQQALQNTQQQPDDEQGGKQPPNKQKDEENQKKPLPKKEKPKERHVAEKVEHWQDGDETIQKAIADLRSQGVDLVTWECGPGACDNCGMNEGKTVKLGEQRFPSGAYISPNHRRCGCGLKDRQGNRYSWSDEKNAFVAQNGR